MNKVHTATIYTCHTATEITGEEEEPQIVLFEPALKSPCHRQFARRVLLDSPCLPSVSLAKRETRATSPTQALIKQLCSTDEAERKAGIRCLMEGATRDENSPEFVAYVFRRLTSGLKMHRTTHEKHQALLSILFIVQSYKFEIGMDLIFCLQTYLRINHELLPSKSPGDRHYFNCPATVAEIFLTWYR